MTESAGLLLYRAKRGVLEVLLAHPGGPFWAGKDAGAWTIPKGEVAPGEDPLAAARREFFEETGFAPDGALRALTPVKQRGGKLVHAWAAAGDWNPSLISSNTFTLEWPPKSGRLREFPEVDRAEWFELAEARRKILPALIPLLDELGARQQA